MCYKLNTFAPLYLEFTDYNLKNIYNVVERKIYGRKVYKIYKKRLIGGLYKFGFYKDIINGELAVIDAGIKKIQVMKDEISGKDYDINLSWVFATKHLETQTNMYGYEYKSIYNLNLLRLALLRFENRNKCFRNQVKSLNLKPSFKLGWTKKGVFLSNVIFKKRKTVKSLLIDFLRLWHSKKLPVYTLKLWSFFLYKTKKRLQNINFLYFYYRLNYIKLYEAIFMPAKTCYIKSEIELRHSVKKPPVWMLRKFGENTRRKWVRGLFFNYYSNFACGIWALPQLFSRWHFEPVKDFLFELNSTWTARRSCLNGVSNISLLKLRDFFSFFYYKAHFVRKYKYKYKLNRKRRYHFNFKFKNITSLYMSNNILLDKYDNIFYNYFDFFLRCFFVNFYSANASKKKFLFEQLLYFICVFLESKKRLYSKSNILFFFGFYELYRYLKYFTKRLREIFLYKERFYVYTLRSHHAIDGLNSYSVPLLKQKMDDLLFWLTFDSRYKVSRFYKFKYFLNKKYSWLWKRRYFRERMMRLFRISKRERGHFRWFNEFSKFNIVKKHKFALKRLGGKRKLNINKKSLSRRQIVLPLVKKKTFGKSVTLRGNIKKKLTNKPKLVSSLLSWTVKKKSKRTIFVRSIRKTTSYDKTKNVIQTGRRYWLGFYLYPERDNPYKKPFKRKQWIKPVYKKNKKPDATIR